jgi:hypothetical protein
LEIICGSRQTENREICELFREAAVCGESLQTAAFLSCNQIQGLL